MRSTFGSYAAIDSEQLPATMRYPWLHLPTTSPYILDEDLPIVLAHSRKRIALAQPNGFINDEVLPEPFIGNPESATVVLLNLNPGDGPGNREAHADTAFRRALLRNLWHKLVDYPFYALNLAFARTPCAQYWTQHVHELFDPSIGGLDRATLASRLFEARGGIGMEVRYRMVSLPLRGRGRTAQISPLPSQEYSFELAKNALGNKLVVGMRARERWTLVDRRFGNVPYLKNPQNSHVSRGTQEDCFNGSWQHSVKHSPE